MSENNKKSGVVHNTFEKYAAIRNYLHKNRDEDRSTRQYYRITKEFSKKNKERTGGHPISKQTLGNGLKLGIGMGKIKKISIVESKKKYYREFEYKLIEIGDSKNKEEFYEKELDIILKQLEKVFESKNNLEKIKGNIENMVDSLERSMEKAKKFNNYEKSYGKLDQVKEKLRSKENEMRERFADDKKLEEFVSIEDEIALERFYNAKKELDKIYPDFVKEEEKVK